MENVAITKMTCKQNVGTYIIIFEFKSFISLGPVPVILYCIKFIIISFSFHITMAERI